MAIMSVDHLHDMDMVNGAGERIGAVKDLLIEAATGQMRYVVVAPGQGGIAGALGIGERLVAIPFSAVRLESGQMLLDRDAAALAGAPAFTRSHPPSFDDAYEQELARYWGVEAPVGLNAGAIATAQLPSVVASAGLAVVARLLAESRSEAAQVVDDGGKPIGVVTLRDVALALGQIGQSGAVAAGTQTAQVAEIGAVGDQAQVPGPAAAAEQTTPGVGAAAMPETPPETPGEMGSAQPVLAVPGMGEQGLPAPTTQPRGQVEGARQEPAVVNCHQCGHANRASATFCAACGTRLR